MLIGPPTCNALRRGDIEPNGLTGLTGHNAITRNLATIVGPRAINFSHTLNRSASGRTWARALVESHQTASPTLPLPSPRGSQTATTSFCLVPSRLP